jgi:hypothetical protein
LVGRPSPDVQEVTNGTTERNGFVLNARALSFCPRLLQSPLWKPNYEREGLKMTKRVYLYAFNNVLEIVDTKFLEDDAISVLNVRRLANWMRDTYPEPVAIYVVDNRRGLHKEYLESVKTKDFTKHVELADIINREGILIQ